MGIVKLNIGQSMKIDGDIYVLDRKVAVNEWQIKSNTTGRYLTKTRDELLNLFSLGKLEFIFSQHSAANDSSYLGMPKESFMAIGLLPDEIQKRVKIKYAYAKAVEDAKLHKFTSETINPIIKDVHEKLKEEHKKPTWWTVNRWRKTFADSGMDIRSLVTRNSRKGNRKQRYVKQFVELVEKAINEIYLTRERKTIQDTLERAVNLVAEENKKLPVSLHLPQPKFTFVKNEIGKIPKYDVCCARYGKLVADKKFRSVTGSIVADRPLERVEIDHTVMDIFLVDDDYFPIGRPTLTICVDVNTRSILGIYVGFEPPSFVTVSQCLKHAFLPKFYIKDKYPSVKNEWEQYGVMEYLVVDNGLEFHGKDLEELCYAFGITIMYMPRKAPWFKGIVERLIGTMNRGVCHGIPGTTFSNFLEKDDYDAAQKATLTLSTFREIVHIWIVDYYHQQIHRTIQDKPINLWRNNISEHEIPLPADINDLEYLLGSTAERVLSHKGIEINSLFYNSEELKELRMRIGAENSVTVRYSKADLGYIHVIDPQTEKPIRVSALAFDYANGLSKWQHDVCKRFAVERLNRTDIEALAEAKQTISDLVANDFGKKKMKTRKRANRFINSADQCKADEIKSQDRDSGGDKMLNALNEIKDIAYDRCDFIDASNDDYASEEQVEKIKSTKLKIVRKG